MLLEQIKEEELGFLELLSYPIAFIEVLFSNLDNLILLEEESFSEVRLYQYPLLSYEYVIDNLPNFSDKDNFKLKENSGSVYCFGGRRYGKTLFVEITDLLMSMYHNAGDNCGFSSFDAMHIRGILEKVIQVLENHSFFKIFEARINRSPTYRLFLKNGYCCESINMNLAGENPGGQFFQKHLTRLFIEEACVDGHTKIRYIDSNNKLKTKNISDLVNSEEYKNVKILSYNEKLKNIEKKKINKVFKKTVKNCEVYKITTDEVVGCSFKTLQVSSNHRLFVNNKYKTPKEVKVGDKMYLLDQCDLSDIQKQVLIGCLLGDSCLNKNNLTSLSITHSIKQKELIDYEKACLQSLFDTYRKTKNNRNNPKNIKSLGNIIRYVSKETKVLKEFNDFKFNKVGNFYTKIDKEQLEKYFSPISLAFFIMDDGSITSYYSKKQNKINKYIYLHTEAFDLDTQQLLIDVFKQKFNINGSICKTKKYYYIAFDSFNSDKIVSLVKDYIHPSMLYKIAEKNNDFIDLTNNDYILYPTNIVDIKKEMLSSWTMYCLEVEDNHNFFANSILTGNSFETQKVYEKRLDAISENGCVYRIAGMTNFTKYSPAGKAFYDITKRGLLVNYPQYVNPKWGEEERQRAIREHGGEDSLGYRIFVKGEVVEDGVSAIDMERVRRNYNPKKVIKHIEVSKENFNNFENIIIVERPANAERMFMCSDIGESVTEIIIVSEVNQNYYYLYNITLYNLTDKEQFKIHKYVAEKISANLIGLDVTDGMGRAIYRSLEEVFPKENLCWVGFNEKIRVEVEKDEKGNVIMKEGQPVWKEEYVDSWSVKRLRDLLYEEGKFELPLDYKFDSQLNQVISTQSGNRTLYTCINAEDHLFAAFRVFGITEWTNYLTIVKSIKKKAFCKTGV